MTHPRSLRTANPADEIDVLFHELVGGRSRAEAASAPRAPLFPELDQALRAPGTRERIRFDEQVTVPVLGKRIDVPYIYENGVINLIKPCRFSGTPDRATRTAAELAIEGDLLARHSVGKRHQLVIVSDFQEAVLPRAETIEGLFEEYAVRVVQAHEVDSFVAEIKQTAH